MRLYKSDTDLGKAIFCEFSSRLIPSITSMDWDSSFASVYSLNNPNLLLNMVGFDVRILPKCRAKPDEFIIRDGIWRL